MNKFQLDDSDVVVVIGSGAGGGTMAHELTRRGLKVVIVDSSALVTHQRPKHDALINASYDWQLDIPLLEDDDNRIARSSAVTEVPSWNIAPLRIVNVHVFASGEVVQDAARAGATSPVAVMTVRQS